MGWKSGRARLTPEEARAQLLSIADELGGTSLIGRYPLRSLAIALAAGFLFSKTLRLWSMAGRSAVWLLGQVIPLPIRPPQTALDKLKARARRRD